MCMVSFLSAKCKPCEKEINKETTLQACRSFVFARMDETKFWHIHRFHFHLAMAEESARF